MTVSVVGLVFQQLAVGYRSSRPAQVHECTGRPELLACTKFVPMHLSNAGDEAARWRGHNDFTERQVEPLHSWPPGDGRAGTMGCRPAWRFQSRASSVPTPQRETGKLTVYCGNNFTHKWGKLTIICVNILKCLLHSLKSFWSMHHQVL